MPSDEDTRTDAGHLGGGNVTQPFVTETYRCVAPYETKDTKNKPFKVAVDEKVDVLIKDKAGNFRRCPVDGCKLQPQPIQYSLGLISCAFVPVQGGGLWRMKANRWPGSLPPIWRSWMMTTLKMKRMGLPKEVHT